MNLGIKYPLGLFLFLFFFIPQVNAHDMSYGFSTWEIGEKEINAKISIDELSIMELGPIDTDENGSLTKEEVEKGLENYILPEFNEKLIVSSNGKEINGQIESISIPDFQSKVIQFNITYQSSEPLNKIKVNYQLFFEKSNGNHRNIATINVFGEKPIEHIFNSSKSTWEWNAEGSSTWSTIGQFILLGVEHILVGYDHILFLVALIIVGLKVKEVIKIITAFTIAHSITLILSSIGIISLNAKFVESVIALSICYIAFENIFKKEVSYRWVITFMFGLIHGFGFAGVLKEIGIPKEHMVSSLLAFNIGVEIGQILLFLAILPILLFIYKRVSIQRVKIAVSVGVFVFGFIWFIERLFELSIL